MKKMLTVGNKVFYPCQGPCLISSVDEKVVAGIPKSFYHLVLLDDSGGELFVPVDMAQARGIRHLLKKSEIPKLLGMLMMTNEIAGDRNQRANDILKRFTSGSAFDLAEIVEFLTELGRKKSITLRESWVLTRARKFLVCELSEVMGETRSAVGEQVDQALNAQKLQGIHRVPNYHSVSETSQSV